MERSELIGGGPAEGLAGLLGAAVPREVLPPLWHWVYLLDRPAQAELGPDGHPRSPEPGLRRMWAGGRLAFTGSLRIGAPATRRTRLVRRTEKAGRTGPLVFRTVGHEVSQAGRVVVTEEQDLVYRPHGPHETVHTGPAVPPGPGEREVAVDPTLLFRFSALTYNAHRIHYDRGFEGYPGLLVHGPLQALLMAPDGPLRTYEYRLVAPLYDFQGLVAGPGYVRDRAGRRTARATWTGPEPAAG